MALFKQLTPLSRRIDFAQNFSAVQSLDELKALADKLYNEDKLIGFDIETGYSGNDFPNRSVNMFHPRQFIAGFSVTNGTSWARYVPVRHDFGNNLDPNAAWEIMKPVLEDKVGVSHNIQFEAENLKALDLKGDGPRIDIPVSRWHDTMIGAYVLSDVPPMPVDGSLGMRGENEELLPGELVKRYIPDFHTENGYQVGPKAYKVNLKSLTKFRYNYDQAEIHSLFHGGGELTAAQKKLIRFNTLPVNRAVVAYACDDAYLCLRLHLDQYERIQQDPFLPNVYKMEMQIAEILGDIRATGVSVDWDGIHQHLATYKKFVEKMRQEARRQFELESGRNLSELNFNSHKQMSQLIFGSVEDGGLGLEPTTITESGAASTDEKSLTSLRKQSKGIDSLLKYRQCVKMGEWFQAWDLLEDQSFDGKLHPSFLQTEVQSGRFASRGPNVQNITKRWWFQIPEGSVAQVMETGEFGEDYWTGNARDFIKASPGYRLLSFDYKSAEIQMLAAIAGETEIIEAFRRDEDFHRWTASLVFGKPQDQVTKAERQQAKTISFASVYGSGVAAMAQGLGITKDEMQKIYDKYFDRFPKLKEYFEQQHELVKDTHEVRTWLGRRAVIWESMHARGVVRSKAPRMSVNIPIQGGATGDYTKLAMVNVTRALRQNGWWGKEVRLLMNQHDSLVFEVADHMDLTEVVDFLTGCVQFSLAGVRNLFDSFESFPPMSVDWEAGHTWGSVVDVEDVDVLNASELHLFPEEVTSDVVKTFREVGATNPGPVEVFIHSGDEVAPLKFKVKAHPEVAYKMIKGDPDIGIDSPGRKVRAEFR